MQQDSAVSSPVSEAAPRSHNDGRWDKKIASIGFGVALLLAIICFATLMNSDHRAAAHVEDAAPTDR